MATSSSATPQERLATSREAMVRHMMRDKRATQSFDVNKTNDVEDSATHHTTATGKWYIVKHAARTWWHHHPLNLAMEITRPVLNHYAREHPVKLVGIAAGIGVVTVLLKPWRLVSLGTVVAATLKSPQLPNFFRSMLSSHLDRDPSDVSRNESDSDFSKTNADTDVRTN